jgi:FKBP-type peptidyl-prolyl cis-trans isomerase
MDSMSPAVKVVLFVGLAGGLVLYGIDYNTRLDRKIADDATIKGQELAAARQQVMNNFKKDDVVVGEGTEAKVGDTARVNYIGTFEDGKEFDNSYKKKNPLEFKLGAGAVIPGWDMGVQGMRVGGKRKLTIPPELGYGPRGSTEGTIPPNATLHFEVELLAVNGAP